MFNKFFTRFFLLISKFVNREIVSTITFMDPRPFYCP